MPEVRNTKTILALAPVTSSLHALEVATRHVGFAFLGTTDGGEAVRMAQANPVDGLLVASGVPHEVRRRVARELRVLNPQLRVIEPRNPTLIAEALRDAFTT